LGRVVAQAVSCGLLPRRPGSKPGPVRVFSSPQNGTGIVCSPGIAGLCCQCHSTNTPCSYFPEY